MKLTAWRICKRKYAAGMWTGIGSRSVAGRWHSKGVAIVYASATRSLAALEALTHLDSAQVLAATFVQCSITFDDSLVTRVDSAALPGDWRSDPPPITLRAIGDGWAAADTSPLLAVPSAIVPEESNYLINPAHADFRKLIIGKVEPFAFDLRLA